MKYKLDKIRQLLEEALTEEQFEDLVHDLSYETREEFTTKSLPARRREFINYVYKQRKIGILLEKVKQLNPTFYKEFENKFGSLLIDEIAEIFPKTVKKEIPPLLPYLPNRHEQEYKLKQAYQKFLNQGLPRPLVCIIHGDEVQDHNTFFDRLQKYAVPQLLGLDRNQTAITKYFLAIDPYLLDYEMQHLENDLCEKLAKELANILYSDNSSLEAINDAFCKNPYPIIVHSDLMNEHWQKNREGLRKVLGFWQKWPDLVAGQQLIICLFVKYKKKQKSAKKLSLGSLNEFFIQKRYEQINTKIDKEISFLITSSPSQFDRIYSVVLPELDDICQADVERWVKSDVERWIKSDETAHFVGDGMTQKLIIKITEMFNSWESETLSNKIPMEYLARKLEIILKSLIEERGVV